MTVASLASLTPLSWPAAEGGTESLHALLVPERSRAEQLIGWLRLGILVVLAAASLAYAPALPGRLRIANTAVLVPVLAFAVFQVSCIQRRGGICPAWLSTASPIVDVTAITAILLCYGLLERPALGLKAPIVLTYFAVLAARPMTASARGAALTAAVATLEYAVAVGILMHAAGHATFVDPITAATSAGVSAVDDGMRVVLLGAAGAIAIYATAWHERVLRRALAAQLARAAEERATTARLQEADKLAALGTLAASIAHEVSNPLTAIALAAELLERDTSEPATRAEAAAIAADAHRTAAVVRDLLAFSRTGTSERGVVALNAVVERALQPLRALLRDGGVRTECHAAPDLPPVLGDAAALERMLINLVINAAHAMAGQTSPRVVRILTRVHDRRVELVVEDTGPGFAPGVAERLFERFFTTKPAGEGTGLGLWMVAQIAESHAGTVTAVDTGSGARFVVTLPALRAAAAA